MTPAQLISPDIVQVVMIVGSFGAAVAAAYMALRGKRGDQSIQQTQGQFDRMLGEITYWKREALDARVEGERRALAAESELDAFRDRQLNRCRGALDGAVQVITRMMRFTPPDLMPQVVHELDDIEAHRVTDHDLEIEDHPPRKDHRD